MQSNLLKQHAVNFDKIHADYLAKGTDLYDVQRLHGGSLGEGRFEEWHKAKGLPDHDEEGKHFRSSKIFFRQYQEDESGKAKAPLFVNVWHYLLKVSEPFDWTTTPNEHHKIVPIVEGMLTIPAEISDEQIEAYREKLKALEGIDEETIDNQVENVMQSRLQTIEARKILIDIINEYGVDDKQFGKILFLEMRVER